MRLLLFRLYRFLIRIISRPEIVQPLPLWKYRAHRGRKKPYKHLEYLLCLGKKRRILMNFFLSK